MSACMRVFECVMVVCDGVQWWCVLVCCCFECVLVCDGVRWWCLLVCCCFEFVMVCDGGVC